MAEKGRWSGVGECGGEGCAERAARRVRAAVERAEVEWVAKALEGTAAETEWGRQQVEIIAAVERVATAERAEAAERAAAAERRQRQRGGSCREGDSGEDGEEIARRAVLAKRCEGAGGSGNDNGSGDGDPMSCAGLVRTCHAIRTTGSEHDSRVDRPGVVEQAGRRRR